MFLIVVFGIMSSRQRELLLKKLYTKAGFSARFSNAKTLLAVANAALNATEDRFRLVEVKKFLETQLVQQLHKQTSKKIDRLLIRALYLDQFWSADLIDMQEFSKSNDNQR